MYTGPSTYTYAQAQAKASRCREGRQKKNPEKTTYICASSQKKVRTYLLFFFSFFFSAFLGVSRQGEFENTRKKIEYVSKKIAGEIFFRGGKFFPGDFF
jgi:hypothetical protein